MMGNYLKQVAEFVQFLIQGKNVLPQSKAVFAALVQAIIPHTEGVAGNQASINENGALELHTDQFQFYSMVCRITKSFAIFAGDNIGDFLWAMSVFYPRGAFR